MECVELKFNRFLEEILCMMVIFSNSFGCIKIGIAVERKGGMQPNPSTP